MNEAFLEVNDYLDLYLLAGSLHDQSWQKQIKEKLENFPKANSQEAVSLNIEKLWNEYRTINTEILDLYHQLRNNTANVGLNKKLSTLETKRKYLSKKIHIEENKLHHHTF